MNEEITIQNSIKSIDKILEAQLSKKDIRLINNLSADSVEVHMVSDKEIGLIIKKGDLLIMINYIPPRALAVILEPNVDLVAEVGNLKSVVGKILQRISKVSWKQHEAAKKQALENLKEIYEKKEGKQD
jgi:hypothetical protein